MNNTVLSQMSIDELWALHEAVAEILATKMLAEKKNLEARLEQLKKSAEAPTPTAPVKRRQYPSVPQKFRNPDAPSETWSGRGKKPRWINEHLRRGKKLEDLLIAPK